MSTEPLLKTPLHALHLELGARMVPFAGYDMPVQYPAGVLKEHLHTRVAAGLLRLIAGRVDGDAARALLTEAASLDEDLPLAKALGFWARLDGRDNAVADALAMTPLARRLS